MRRVGLRARLTLFFAAVVFGILILFGGVVVGDLVVVERGEQRERQRAGLGPEEDPWEGTRKGAFALLFAIPLGTAGAAALGWLIAKRSLAPLAEAGTRAQAARESAGELSLPVNGTGDEWDELAVTLNALLADSRSALERIRNFTSDAAHELRTPLTAIIGEAELALRRERSNEELRLALQTVRSEGVRLASLVDALLTLARGDTENLVVREEVVGLDEIVRESAARAARLAEQPGRRVVKIQVEGRGGPVRGDPVLLSRVVDNLLDNASRHGGALVQVRLATTPERVKLTVSDDGPGIPAELEPRIFERFARGDSSRVGDGFGLGLAIARTIVRLHGGELRLQRARPAEFALELPAVSE